MPWQGLRSDVRGGGRWVAGRVGGGCRRREMGEQDEEVMNRGGCGRGLSGGGKRMPEGWKDAGSRGWGEDPRSYRRGREETEDEGGRGLRKGFLKKGASNICRIAVLCYFCVPK